MSTQPQDNSKPKVSIISATRHESHNVWTLYTRVCDSLNDHYDWDLVFVDDSDDDTPVVIAGICAKDPRVRLLHRPAGHRRGGLSGALTLGFRRISSPTVAVIDADLQHPPELLPALLQPLTDDMADLTVASRYISGGSSSGLDGPYRRAVSKGAVRVVQGFFPRLRRVTDPASGYFAIRTNLFDAETLKPEGFKMLVELLVRANWQNHEEVPYHFEGRAFGASKATPKLGLYFLRHVWRLWVETEAPRPLSRFGRSNPAHPRGPVLTEASPEFANAGDQEVQPEA